MVVTISACDAARGMLCLVLSPSLISATQHCKIPGNRCIRNPAAGIAILEGRMDGTWRGEGPEKILAALPYRELDPNLLRCAICRRFCGADGDLASLRRGQISMLRLRMAACYQR